jgi:OOP family OmpA-OmpF porin
MSYKKNVATVAFLGIAAMASSSAYASTDMPGFYLGGSVGQAKERNACVNTISCSDTDTGLKVFAGYQFNRNLALEGGYIDFGKASLTFPGANLTIKAKAYTLAAVGMIPLANGFALFGKAGAYRTELKAAGTAVPAPFTVRNSGLTYGIGGQWNVAKNLDLRLEYERFKDVGEKATIGQNNVDLFTAGLSYKF